MFNWLKRIKANRQRKAILAAISPPNATEQTKGYTEAKLLISLFVPEHKPLTKIQFESTVNDLKLRRFVNTDSKIVPELMLTENGHLKPLPKDIYWL